VALLSHCVFKKDAPADAVDISRGVHGGASRGTVNISRREGGKREGASAGGWAFESCGAKRDNEGLRETEGTRNDAKP